MSKPSLELMTVDNIIKIINNVNTQYGDLNKYYPEINKIVFENILIEEDLFIDRFPFAGLSIEFINCNLSNAHFKEITANTIVFVNTKLVNLNFDNVRIPVISFDLSCKITDKLNILASFFTRIEINFPINIIHIKDCEGGRKDLSLNNEVEYLLILNTDKIFVNCFHIITNCYLQNASYPFTTQVRIKSLRIFGGKVDGYISGLFEDIEINDSFITHYQNIICLNNFYIKESHSINDQPLLFFNIYVGNDLIIDSSNIDAVFNLNKNTSPYFFINNLRIISKLRNILFNNTEEDIFFHINSIEFRDFSFSKDAIWKLEKILCSNILFYNFRNFGSGNIDNTKKGYFNPLHYNFIELIKIIKPFNTNYTAFFSSDPPPINYDSKKDCTLVFRQSDFGKLNFINTDFSDFKLNFYSTKLNEIFLAGSKMPKKVTALNHGTIDGYHQERIANSQLKKLHEQQGDVVAANEYFANEMNAYFYSLNWGKIWKKQFWEKTHLGLNKISSNHGQSWILALLVTVIMSSSLYTCFCCLIQYFPANPLKSENWATLWKLFPYYFEFINPIHKLEDFDELINKSRISSSARTLDHLSRIIDSYLIYQLIQAFRKHGRSK